ncbi:OmcA/MtrC family decaheme c-type cytochrome [Shewanella subflava]|uniref:OmcA/MtrC family decaheme c-type cytochrome n=1 Tax=Shewanella subflava TaxID=2986476 RepID=A0ABT3I500_9GAMM|nr:OmcA/MtrC family decaheme c-type cytochrome [Shewanella subflava]MCW3171087.1 OmcA/MtrC family decaheme c-type cytochrome [Shewanella subflava]
MMNTKYSKIALLLATATSMTLAGCGGDDGNPGNPGNPGGEPAEAIKVLNLDITKVTYEDGKPHVEVFATSEDDLPVIGLQKLEIKKVVQLVPTGATGAGNSAQWQYIGAQNAFTDLKNGKYSFVVDVEGYNPQLTQRYNVIAAASTLADGKTTVPRTEYTEDFSGEGYEALYSKNVVSNETCNTCHAKGESIYHSYTSLQTCTSCHTNEMADEKGKVQVGFDHLIHNVHNNNKMYGRNMDKSADAAHAIVQDNCQTCHVESEELTEWSNWTRIPTMETCTSCHTNIDFKAGQGHSQQLDNSNCIACHNASWTEELHTGDFVQKKAFINQYGMTATLVANKATDADLSATLSVTILNADGAATDAASLISKIQRLETITNVGPNFPIMGYNKSPGSGLAKIAKDLVSKGQLVDGAAIVDGNLEFVIPSLPFGNDDTDTAFTFIGLEMCNDGMQAIDCAEGVATTGMKAELVHATYSGNAPSYRHVNSVGFNTCQNCHGDTFEIHKGHHAGFVMTEQVSHTNDANDKPIIGVDACVACHTPDGTYASGAKQGALEMKLHSVHGEQGIIKDCTQCHNDFNLDAFKLKGALATAGGGDSYTTPITATCASCHGFEAIKTHAEGQGAVINGSYQEANAAAQLETCFFCHAPSIENHSKIKM